MANLHKTISLQKIRRTEPDLLDAIKRHYTGQKGLPPGRVFPARIVDEDGRIWGYIAGSSSCYVNVGKRNEYFDIDQKTAWNAIVNNSFFHVERDENGNYPCREFTEKVLKLFRSHTVAFWKERYDIDVRGFETMVGLSDTRDGEIYARDHWDKIGMTKGMHRGYGCGKYKGKDNKWTANGVPKQVMVRKV